MNFASSIISSTVDSTSSNTGALQVVGGVGIGKALYVQNRITSNDSLYLPSGGISFAGSTNLLNYYDSGSTTASFNTGSTTVNVYVAWIRCGKLVTVLFQQSALSAANAAIQWLGIPAGFRPYYGMDFSVTVTSNSVIKQGRLTIAVGGLCVFWSAYPAVNFANNSCIGAVADSTGVSVSYLSA
jgi:hypothetical protein